MINKLKSRIFGIIMISLVVIVLGVINLFAILNYRNTINASSSMMERFGGFIRKNDFTMERPEKPSTVIQENKVEGVYSITIENSKIIETTDTSDNEEIKEYALKLKEKTDKQSGIIGNYIYRIRKIDNNEMEIMFMENEDAITHARIIIVAAILLSFASIIIIYILAKKISKIIVKPVQETFEKQKQFISDASHELKTPLAVIEANADVLENEVGENKWLGYIQNELESMDKLINELLMLTKIENVDSIKDYKDFNLSTETEIIISMFESMAYEKGVKIETKIAEDITMNGCKEDIEHIVSTLLDNAIKHTDKDNKVIIELEKEKNEIVLQVENMGEPIPEEDIEKIFERFYRVDKSRNRDEKRYGLGLAIAKSTVEKYKGKIEVNCNNGFTIFKVSIPM